MATAFGELPGVTFIYAVHVGADAAAAGIKGSSKRYGGGIAAAPSQCGNVAASVNPLKARYNDNLSVLQFPQNPAAVQCGDFGGAVVAIGMKSRLTAGKGNSG